MGNLQSHVQTVGTCHTPPPTGMVSWYPGDGNANDIVGTNDGTLNGVTFTAGKVGQAFSFNGTDAYVRVLDNANLYPGAGPFTVDAWIKTTQMSPGNAFVLAHYECANNCPSFVANSVYAMYVDGNGKLFRRNSTAQFGRKKHTQILRCNLGPLGELG